MHYASHKYPPQGRDIFLTLFALVAPARTWLIMVSVVLFLVSLSSIHYTQSQNKISLHVFFICYLLLSSWKFLFFKIRCVSLSGLWVPLRYWHQKKKKKSSLSNAQKDRGRKAKRKLTGSKDKPAMPHPSCSGYRNLLILSQIRQHLLLEVFSTLLIGMSPFLE